MSILRSEVLVGAWQDRYVRGACELDEMEAGIARALTGESSDDEYVRLAMERRFTQPVAEMAAMMAVVVDA